MYNVMIPGWIMKGIDLKEEREDGDNPSLPSSWAMFSSAQRSNTCRKFTSERHTIGELNATQIFLEATF